MSPSMKHKFDGDAPGLGPFCTVCGTDDFNDPICTDGSPHMNRRKVLGTLCPDCVKASQRAGEWDYCNAHVRDSHGHHPPWHPCGTWADLYVPELNSHYGKCPECPVEPGDEQ